MKKTKIFFAVLLSLIFVFALTSCGKGDIAKINGKSTVYQYNVSEIIMLKGSNGEKLESELVEGYYYFSTNKDLTQKSVFSSDEEWFVYDYFDKIELDEYSQFITSTDYNCAVSFMLVFDGVEEVYAPTYEVEQGLVTVNYYEFEGSTENNIYSKIYTYDEAVRLYQDYTAKLRGLSSESEEYKDLQKKYRNDMKNSIVIAESSYTKSAESLEVQYVVE